MFRLRAHPELPLHRPIWTWKPGDPEPPLGVVSYRLRNRWNCPLELVTIYTASDKAARICAGAGGYPSHPLHITHDLHLSSIYIGLLQRNPVEAKAWVSERALAPLRRGHKLPDAEVQDAAGRTVKVIEFGGSYPPERVLKVHQDCERRQVPYELW